MASLSTLLALTIGFSLVASVTSRAATQLPAHDDCGNAIPIGDGTITGSTFGATISTNGCGLSGLTPDVWYSYTAQHSGLLALDTCGSSFDTSITLYAACNQITQQLACNDDAPPGSPCGYQTWNAYLTYPVVAGQTLKIRISGFIGLTGAFVLTTHNETGHPFCLGDGTSARICPCSNTVPASHMSGCRNSTGTGGRLVATGSAEVSGDTVQLVVTGLPGSTSLLFFQGSTKSNNGYGGPFGDGLRCVTGTVVRLWVKPATGGFGLYPGPGEPRVSVKGLIPASGGTRFYQAWYRNAAAFCTSSTFNLTNGLEVAWSP